jgi:uncharacterized membrane protein YraQ (UPF0718 family)
MAFFRVAGGILWEAFNVLNEASLFLLVGLALAGTFKVVFSQDKLFGRRGESGVKSVVRAALFGIPLPICSCGVVPMALSMRRQGLSKGASLAFLVSTPETGVDSIAVSYALLGPVFAVFRPLAAMITAVITGLWANVLRDDSAITPISEDLCRVCDVENGDGEHSHSGREKISSAFRYAFDDFFGDIAKWMFLGFLLAGVFSYMIPDDFFSRYMGGNFSSMLVMLAVGVPIYICASASTPIAAALILRGLNPGAALVFLLAGPATNLATITMVGRYMGKRVTAVYLVVVCVMSLVMGYILNLLTAGFGLDLTTGVAPGTELLPYWLKAAASATVIILFLRCLIMSRLSTRSSGKEPCCRERPLYAAGELTHHH